MTDKILAVDEVEIRGLVQQMEDGWNALDGAAYAAPFAPDADYVIWTGRHIRGRDVICEGHEQIFSTIYKDSRIKITVEQIRLLRPDVAVVQVHGQNEFYHDGAAQQFEGRQLLVLVKEADGWQIAAFQNTRLGDYWAV